MLTVYVGVVVIAVGLILMLVGVAIAWQEWQDSRRRLGPTEFVNSLAALLKALAGQPTSTALFAFGTLLVFLGGIIAGVGGFSM